MELATGMRPATYFANVLCKARFVACVIVTDETPLPTGQELTRHFTGWRGLEVVDHALYR